MLYNEAYELIDIVLSGHDTSVPLSATLKKRFYNDAVRMMNRQYVRNIEEEDFAGNSSTTKYIFANDNASARIYQVMFKSSDASPAYKDIPFLPQSLVTNPDEMVNPSYVVRHESSKTGIVTDILPSTNVITTSEAHGLAVGDYVNITNVPTIGRWFEHPSGEALRMKVTAVPTEDTFTLGDDTINGLAQSSIHIPWQQNQVEIIFSKAPGAGTITVRYYADPQKAKDYTAHIDLPESLCKASVYCALKELFALDSSIDISKAMNDIANMYEEEYTLESTVRQPHIDKLPMPLQDFT
tara:strand:+ start:26 stop:916 length:891 start_codon:yes stop_codon:yes gene_type:complete